MKRTCFADENCPVARGYNAIGDWWSLLIVARVLTGLRRFSELQEALGLAKNILTARLKKLVEQGILEKVPASDGSAYHEYVATEKGRDLHVIVVALRQWGEKHFFDTGGCGTVLVDKENGRPVPPVQVRADDGRVLGPEDVKDVKCAGGGGGL